MSLSRDGKSRFFMAGESSDQTTRSQRSSQLAPDLLICHCRSRWTIPSASSMDFATTSTHLLQTFFLISLSPLSEAVHRKRDPSSPPSASRVYYCYCEYFNVLCAGSTWTWTKGFFSSLPSWTLTSSEYAILQSRSSNWKVWRLLVRFVYDTHAQAHPLTLILILLSVPCPSLRYLRHDNKNVKADLSRNHRRVLDQRSCHANEQL